MCDSVHFKPVLRVGQTKTSLGKTSFQYIYTKANNHARVSVT